MQLYFYIYTVYINISNNAVLKFMKSNFKRMYYNGFFFNIRDSLMSNKEQLQNQES